MDLTKFLEPDEKIELEAEAMLKLGLIQLHAGGRAASTDERIVWIGRSPWLSAYPFYKWRKVISIPLDEIIKVRLHPSFGRSWLEIETEQERYSLVVGKGPFPLIYRTPETAKLWYTAIKAGRRRILGEQAESALEDELSP